MEKYARILKKTKKQLSEDLAIHYTRLSRIIYNKEEPNTERKRDSKKLLVLIMPFEWVYTMRQHESYPPNAKPPYDTYYPPLFGYAKHTLLYPDDASQTATAAFLLLSLDRRAIVAVFQQDRLNRLE